VTLSGLHREELGLLLSGLSGEPANPRLVEWMHTQTAGNPYFAKELFRLLRSRGLADAQEPIERLPVPDSIGSVLHGRLAMLPPETADMLARAAVLGQEFDLDTLQTLCTVERHALVDMLKDAVRASVLVSADRWDRYAFVHALMRETLYGELSEGRRTALHLLAGQILERRPSGVNGDLDQIAEHFLRAGPEGDPEKERFLVKRYPKNNEPRTFGVRQVWLDEVATHIRTKSIARNDLLFTTRVGTPISRNTFRTQVWLPTVRASGVDFSVRIHDLRHAHASWLLAGGSDLRSVMDRMGHHQIQTTQKYLHTLPDADRKNLDALDRIGRGKGT
jgi:hypothetical protein